MTEEHNHSVPCVVCVAELELRVKNEEHAKNRIRELLVELDALREKYEC